MPAVSILMPVKNGAAHLGECLASIEAQTLTDYELVAVDDGSTDATPALLSEAARRDPRIRPLYQPPAGIVAALELAAAHARAPLLARMDGDDAMMPHRLEAQLHLLGCHPHLALVTCGVQHHPATPPGPGMEAYCHWLNSLNEPEDFRRERFIESPLAHPAVMMRRDAYEAAGGYRDTPWAEDYDLWLRMLEAGHAMARHPETLLLWRDHPHRSSRRDGRYSPAQFMAAKAHYLVRWLRQRQGGDADRPDGASPPEVIVWGGRTARRMAAMLVAQGVRLLALVDVHPRRIGTHYPVPGRQFHAPVPVLAPAGLPPPGRHTLLALAGERASVAPRSLIRQGAHARGYREGHDFLCLA